MTHHAAPAALELRGVGKRFGRAEIIRDVSLTVRDGERVAIIGPNGAGKSTLFNLICGGCGVDCGQILLHGQRIDGLAPHEINRRGLARSFQISSLFARLSVFENLRCAALWSKGHGYTFWRFLSGLKDVNERAAEVLELIGLAHRRDDLAMDLTYAEQRALEVGLAVAGRPRVMLLDEPTAGMSRSETQRFVALIRQVSQGATLLMVEHDMGVVFDLADRIAVLAGGALMAFGTPAAVRADMRVQQAYLGTALAGQDGPAVEAAEAAQAAEMPATWPSAVA